jgi:hypothetical protein
MTLPRAGDIGRDPAPIEKARQFLLYLIILLHIIDFDSGLRFSNITLNKN